MLPRWGGILFYFASCGLAAAQPADCAVEMQNERGVRPSPASFVPFYYDLELASWLTSLYARSQPQRPAVVLPLYAPDPLLFAAGDRIYISTAAILQFDREADLALTLESVAKPRPPKHTVPPAACLFPPALVQAISFEDRRTRLQERIAAYREWTERRLKIRAAGQR